MKIAGWHIEGFGIFQDVQVKLGGGLTLFLGPNEAGKSTLFGFLRAMLFGFPSRRSRTPQYPPLRGGRHGGRLILDGPQGEIVVERIAGRKNTLRLNGREENAREETEGELRSLLGGADENVFCSVFAFSLAEMKSLEWLRAEQVRERIFSAGIAGAGACARQVIDTLEAEAALQYRPRGSSKVRDLADQIELTQKKLKAARDESERYVTLEQESGKWSARAAQLSEEEADLRLKQRAMEKALELWSRREKAQRELAALEAIDRFPADPEIRLAALHERIEAAKTLMTQAEADVGARKAQRAELVFQKGLEELYAQVEDLNGKIALHKNRLESLAALSAEKEMPLRVLVAAVICVFIVAGWLSGRNGASGVALLAIVAVVLAASVALAANVLKQRAVGAAKLKALKREIAAWEEPAQGWLASVSAADRLISEFIELRTRCQKDREVRLKAASLDQACAEAQANLEASRKKLAEAGEALAALFAEAGAADEPEFEARLRTYKKRQESAALIQDHEARIEEPAGPEEWTGELHRVRETLADVQKMRDEAVGEQRLADAERVRIAESDTVPALQSEMEWLKSDLAAAVRQWRIAILARELVARTLQEYTRTRQPAVLEEASSAFARVTSGAYERIIQDDDSEGLVVLDRNSQRKWPEELSRGTAEQLYLCLRLGLASEFARRSTSLPLIMDDVLVNFDPERARAVAQELAYYSRDRQVLIFTCHPETARIFAEVAPEMATIRMERFGAPPMVEQAIGLGQEQG